MFRGDGLGHIPEKDIAIRHRERVGVFEIEFKLRIAVLVIERIHVPAETVYRRDHFIQPRKLVHEPFHVVAAFFQVVVAVRHEQAALFVLLEHIDFALDAEVEAEAQFGRLAENLFQQHARIERIGLAMKMVVRRHPRDFLLPRQLDDMAKVRHGRDFVIVRCLTQTIQRVTGVKFRAPGKMLEVINRHELALGHAVDVHISANAVFDALFDQALFDFF